MTSNTNTMDIQQQVRNNASELNDFLKGMKTWQQEMQAKDNQLLEAARLKKEKELDKAPSSRKLISPPPMRTSRKTDELQKIKKSKDNSMNDSKKEENIEKIKAYDYSAWDKFDVDKACNEIDDKESVSNKNTKTTSPAKKSGIPVVDTSDSANQTTHENNTSKLILKQQAIAEKDRGNNYFKNGKYTEAIECYTKGIHCDPSNAVLPANRAMALLKTGQSSEAESDCTLSLSIDPTYVKAYQRRATARSNLKRYEDAAKDYNMVLDLEPNNKVAKIELDKVTSKLNDEQLKSSISVDKDDIAPQVKTEEAIAPIKSFENNIKSAFSSSKSKQPSGASSNSTSEEGRGQIQLSQGQVMPIVKKPHLRSKKPLRRIPITEMKSSGEPNATVNQPSAFGKSQDNDFIIRKSSKQNEEQILGVSKEKKGKIKIEEIDSTETQVAQEVINEQKEECNLGKISISKSKGSVKIVEEDLAKSLENVTCSTLDLQNKTTPVSSVSFYSTWNNLRNASDEEKIDYLNVMLPKDYPVIFKHSLEPSVFEEILRLLARLTTKDAKNIVAASSHLYGLSKVPRVSAMVMFLSQDDKKNLKVLIDDVQKCGTTRQNRKEAIKKLLH